MCSEMEKCQQEALLRCLLFGLGVAIVRQFIYNKEKEVVAMPEMRRTIKDSVFTYDDFICLYK